MIILIIVGILAFVFGIIWIVINGDKDNSTESVVESPPSIIPKGKRGIYKGKLRLNVYKNKHAYHKTYETIKFSTIVTEKRRFGDEIEVVFHKVINSPDWTAQSVLDELKDKHTLLRLEDVEWEYDVEDITLSRVDLRNLLNKNEIVINDVHIRIGEDVERTEILDIVIEETHE